ncbi:MAG: sulfoxide reductase heme-binding subunit YedZ [Betaproteobacteria bacterium]|jgi:sulfoxide reductase heme-binding subunit YedZ|nr:sulfoxide reductase heme-binding subunit YedZ [Betaproteobacteria bacterium]
MTNPRRALDPSTLARSLTLIRFSTIGPVVWLVTLAFADQLGANPIEKLIRETGTWALIWLSASLSVTPIRAIAARLKPPGFQILAQLGPLRRTFGLTAFCYALLHFSAYAAWDQGFELGPIIADVIKRPFIAVGMASLLGLSLLAATSPKRVVRWLGGLRWRRVHRLIYLIGPLVLLHFTWHKAGKNDFERPILYGTIIGIGLLMRIGFSIAQRRAKP